MFYKITQGDRARCFNGLVCLLFSLMYDPTSHDLLIVFIFNIFKMRLGTMRLGCFFSGCCQIHTRHTNPFGYNYADNYDVKSKCGNVGECTNGFKVPITIVESLIHFSPVQIKTWICLFFTYRFIYDFVRENRRVKYYLTITQWISIFTVAIFSVVH